MGVVGAVGVVAVGVGAERRRVLRSSWLLAELELRNGAAAAVTAPAETRDAKPGPAIRLQPTIAAYCSLLQLTCDLLEYLP